MPISTHSILLWKYVHSHFCIVLRFLDKVHSIGKYSCKLERKRKYFHHFLVLKHITFLYRVPTYVEEFSGVTEKQSRKVKS